MGVKDLWKLLEPAGRPVDLEQLQGLVLAIDVSVWLHQAVHGSRERSGQPLQSAHLSLLFSRICKLLHYQIKPVFVFDGGVPALKTQTIAVRSRRRQAAGKKGEKAEEKRRSKYMQARILQQLTGETSSTVVLPPRLSSSGGQDMFELPPLPQDIFDKDRSPPFTTGTSDTSFVEDVERVDINSSEFGSLPPELKHEILQERQELERHTFTDPGALPEVASDFSSYQLSRLMKRSKLTRQLEDVRRCLKETGSEVIGGQTGSFEVEANRIMSSDSAHYILVKGVVDVEGSAASSSQDECNDVIVGKDDVIGNEHPGELEAEEEGRSDVIVCKNDVMAEIAEKEVKRKDDVIPLATVATSIVGEPPVDRDHQYATSFPEEEEDENEKVSTSEPLASEAMLCRVEAALLQTDKEKPDVLAVRTEYLPKPESAKSPASNEPKLDVVAPASTITESAPVDNVCHEGRGDIGEVCEEGRGDVGEVCDEGRGDIGEACEEGRGDIGEVCDEGRGDIGEVCDEGRGDLGEVCDEGRGDIGEEGRGDIGEVCDEDIGEVCEEGRGDVGEVCDEGRGDIGEVCEEGRGEVWEGGVLELSPREAQTRLREEVEQLGRESERQRRAAASLAGHIYREAQELLALFGLPYILSPMEAEAQCAHLDPAHLTHGSITDDSDVFLFGGQNVYRHFFSSEHQPSFFSSEDIQSLLGLTRERLVCLAYLLGSDYTPGLDGVGVVNAMEVIAQFRGEGCQGLERLKEWHSMVRAVPGLNLTSSLERKLRALDLPDDFPSKAVWQAYMSPEVDTSNEQFTWGTPDLDLIRKFMLGHVGWNQDRVDSLLLPVLKRAHNREMRITSYFTPSSLPHHCSPPVITSKRLRNVVARIRDREEDKSPESVLLPRSKKAKIVSGSSSDYESQSVAGRRGRRGRGRGRGKGRARGKKEVTESATSSTHKLSASSSSSSDQD